MEEGLSADAIPADITIGSSVAALVSRIIDNFGKIDILVNSAGTAVSGQWRTSPRRNGTTSWIRTFRACSSAVSL